MQLEASIRGSFGKTFAKQLRKEALVPASIYMQNGKVLHFSVPSKPLAKAAESFTFLNTPILITEGKTKIQVLPKTIDFHPVTDTILHVEFKEIPAKGNCYVRVPISITNKAKSIGIKAGGKLNLPNHSVLVECKPSEIPTTIEVDISSFGIGRSIFTRHLKSGSNYTFPKDSFVLSILGRGRKDKGEEETGAEEAATESEKTN